MADLAIPSQGRLLEIIELQNAIASMNASGDDVMRFVADRAAGLTHATGVVVALVEGDDLVYRATSGSTKTALGTRLSVTSTLAARCIADRKPLRIDDVGSDPRADADTRGRHGVASVVDVPILYGEHPVGVLELVGAKPGAFTDEDVETLRLLSNIVAIALHKAHSYPRPRTDTSHDGVTGLENRRAFEDRVQAELGRSKRYGQSFSLALLDLEGFTTAADRFGQATADQILREIATILKGHTRVIDACFRLGGDEFAIVLPGTALEGARILSERCRVTIGEAKLCETIIKASFGVVESADETEPDALMTRAASALSADKDARR